MKRRCLLGIFALIPIMFMVACGETEKEIDVVSVSISLPCVEMVIGETLSLNVSVSPSNATHDGFTWSSTKPMVASVSESGLVTAISEGNTIVTVMAGGKKADCSVTVVSGDVLVTSISLNKEELNLVEGESETLVATISPDNATDKTVIWTSSDDKVASVDNGVVTAISEGETTITAKAGDNSSFCRVIVTKKSIDIESISLNKTEIILVQGNSESLFATVSPENASDKSVTWNSDAPTIASVDENGTVSANSIGTATITAKAGDKTANCSVTVTESLELVIEQEREALISIYKALDGDNWNNNTNWCSDLPVGEWFGIHTTYNGLVSEILLTSNGLNGTITSDMLAFRELRELYLENNPLRLELTDEKPLWFNSLWRFDLKYCKPYTSLPEWFYELPSIAIVEMPIERIPPEIGRMTGLIHLDLLTLPAPIPDEIGQLTNLQELWIDGSFGALYGDDYLPSVLNAEGGPLPESIGNLRGLKDLSIYGMNCTGSIPPSLTRLKGLNYLSLTNNHFSGEIPSEIGQLTGLLCLDLSYNQLTGSLPESICNLSLHGFGVCNNDLSGELPANMGRLFNSLRTDWDTDFAISGNHFSGKIPDSILSHPKWKYFWYPFFHSNNFDLQGITIPGPDIKGKDIFGNPVDSDQIYINNKLTILYQYTISFGDRVGFPRLSYVKNLFDAYKDKSVQIIAWGEEAETIEKDIAFVHQNNLEDWIFLNAYQRYVNGHSYYPYIIYPDLILIDHSGNVILDSVYLAEPGSYDEITHFIEDYFANYPF